jgi:hypothetical protein
MYDRWLRDERPDLMAALPELRGKDLVCGCAPLACHGDVLLRLANAAGHLSGDELCPPATSSPWPTSARRRWR